MACKRYFILSSKPFFHPLLTLLICFIIWALSAVSSSNTAAEWSRHNPSFWLATLLEKKKKEVGLSEDAHCLLNGSSSLQYKVRNGNLTRLAPKQRLLRDVYSTETGARVPSSVKPSSASKLPDDSSHTQRLHSTAQSLHQPKRRGYLTSKHSPFGGKNPQLSQSQFSVEVAFSQTLCKSRQEKMLRTVTS